MRCATLRCAPVLLGLFIIVGTPAFALAADPDWKAVEQTLGKSGQMQPGAVFLSGCRGPTLRSL
jgi:hypothetical protein